MFYSRVFKDFIKETRLSADQSTTIHQDVATTSASI